MKAIKVSGQKRSWSCSCVLLYIADCRVVTWPGVATVPVQHHHNRVRGVPPVEQRGHGELQIVVVDSEESTLAGACRYLHLAHSDHHLLLHRHHCPPHLLQHPNIQNIILVYEVWKVQRACCSGIVATESSEQQLSCSNSEFFCSFYLGSSGQEINWDGNNKQTNYTDLTFTFRHPTSRCLVNFRKPISSCHLYNLWSRIQCHNLVTII